MKKFIVMILCVSTFFVGLGSLVESVGARFKSDERALEIMRQARQAIGGEQNIKAMQALTIKGKATKSFAFDTNLLTESGDWELNLQLPNKMSKMLKIETENISGSTNSTVLDKKVDVVVVRRADGTGTETVTSDSPKKVTVVTKDENGNVITEEERLISGDSVKVVNGGEWREQAENMQRNDLFRTMLSLFLTPPQGVDVAYIYAGETTIDGTVCEIVQISGNGSSVKLFINKSTHLPVMMSYTEVKPMIFTFTPRADGNAQEVQGQKIIVQKSDIQTVQGEKITMSSTEAQTGEFQVKFSDYRTVNGLQLPFKWTQTVDGKADETIQVSAYEFNPANIAEKFKELPQRIMIRTEKP